MIILFIILATVVVFLLSYNIEFSDDSGNTGAAKIFLCVLGMLGVACFCWSVQHYNIIP